MHLPIKFNFVGHFLVLRKLLLVSYCVYRVALNFCGSLILPMGEFLCFVVTNSVCA